MTLKPERERAPVVQMWRFVGVGMTVVVMLAALVVLVASRGA